MATTSTLSTLLLLFSSPCIWGGPIEPSALSLRLILGPKGMSQAQQSIFQERSGSLDGPSFPDQPLFFTAQARMALQAQPLVPFEMMERRDLEIQPDDAPVPSAQRRMDADEELLAQMPFSAQRRMDVPSDQEGLLPSPGNGEPLAVIPIQLVAPQQANIFPDMAPQQAMPFFIQVPMNQPRMDMPGPQRFPMQMPMMAEMQAMGPPPPMEQVSMVQPMMQADFQPREFQPIPMVQSLPEDVESPSEDGEAVEADSDDAPAEKADEVPEEAPTASSSKPSPAPVAVQAEQQRIVVVQQSAARLRPVVVDSLETVLQFFNAVAPQAMANATSTPAPPAEEGRQIEDLTSQVADALSSLTAQAKKLLPVILQAGRNLTAGLAEQGFNASARLDPGLNEVTPSPPSSPTPLERHNLTETLSRYVHINQDDFRRTWKHFLHNYWNYVQKVLESIQ